VASQRIEELLAGADELLGAVSGSPRLDAELLLGHVLGLGRAALRARRDHPVAADAAACFGALLRRRAAGEPLAYLTGRRAFWTLELSVGPGVLVPRPETELLVETALERLAGHPGPAVLDLGTGSGAIALAIAAELPAAEVTAVDASDGALRIARRNAVDAGLDRVRFLRGDWFEPVAAQRFDVIVANPPYLAASDPHLPALVHEPRGALVAGPTGLEALREIAMAAPRFLRSGGHLLLEHGADQGSAVRALCASAGLVQAGTIRDLAGLERVTTARAPVECTPSPPASRT
jgi:release factor glutamine methyltransferase